MYMCVMCEADVRKFLPQDFNNMLIHHRLLETQVQPSLHTHSVETVVGSFYQYWLSPALYVQNVSTKGNE